MAGYVKVWTSLRSNDKYLALPGLQRGAYLQLLLWCKDQRDDGVVTASGWTQVGVELGVDRRTARHICDNLATKLLLTHDKNAQGIISIHFANYKQWQEIKVKEVVKRTRSSVQKCTPLRPDQTRPDQTIHSADKPPKEKEPIIESEHKRAIRYFCDTYLKKQGVKYHFTKGKDGMLISQLLKTYGFDFLCRLVDQIYVTNDEFIINKGKVTIGVLSACANKLTQEIVNRKDMRSAFTEKERQSLMNIAQGLGLDHQPLELKNE